MKSAQEVTAEKLRGGYYTPPSLAQFCLGRLSALAPDGRAFRLLEPSIGDGAFVRSLGASALRNRIREVLGFEVLDIEAEKARHSLVSSGLAGHVATRSVIDWAATSDDEVDLAVGNPPFVRFQFVSTEDRIASEQLASALGLTLRGVSNLWIPVLLGALSKLRGGGAFAFVIPTECFTGCSAQVARDWLLAHTEQLHFDLFPPGSFPDVLQEVTVMSGHRNEVAAAKRRATVAITEHDRRGKARTWRHSAQRGKSWTRYLLEPKHLEAVAEASALAGVRRLGEVAAFEVSIVTGANDFFSVDRATLEGFRLAPWARPLLPRTKYARGLRYGADDHLVTEADGRAWILDFAADRPSPDVDERAAEYLRLGEARQLHTRFKCRIREPWYRVPNFRRGSLLLSKRSHEYPRVIVNDASVFTTDTIYRGRVLDDAVDPVALAASFHNSLTMLTAEIEGRSFGGGVLEMVPSEIGRLLVPVIGSADSWIDYLDRGVRDHDSRFDLVARTDALIAQSGAVPPGLLATLAEARLAMLARRLDRNSSGGAVAESLAA